MEEQMKLSSWYLEYELGKDVDSQFEARKSETL